MLVLQGKIRNKKTNLEGDLKMRELRMKILDKLDFESDEIAEEIGNFEVVEEFDNYIIIETEFGEEYRVDYSKMTAQIIIERI